MTHHALLLANLGSPASTSVADVRSYLNQFLMDPYVIDLPWPVRRLLVSLILLKRPAQSAHAYQSIWWPQGSPLVAISRQLTEAIRPLWTQGPVELAMRYGEPSIETTLRKLAGQGITQVTFAPLYPQFADSTTTTALVEARRVIAAHRLPIKLAVLQPFYAEAEYLDALADSARPYLQQGFDHLLLSYHGLPERHLHKTDPTGSHCLKGADCCQRAQGAVLDSCYRAQCYRVSAGFAERSGLGPEQYSVAFQSRLGRAKWIEPYTEARLAELAAQGVKKLLVMCPAFVADCIETLEEIGIRGREQFIAAGGEELLLVPCLNAQPQWVAALARICARVPQAL
ncbi:ferrochelatase [Pseudomonas sp. N040]|uniref:ferrochelatase n=1 Tax=Pseudomonas sp. N040 TaxID=2785325 RepID=UPI0018A2BABB|nr:ferrochelatase [Pseudomonas sp. N040]MBF7730541.1 ferrochelatase [Pseudomonas sp. N040]MBW7014185.1 ferrochelatase [Pseudomonas sp. N040]